MRSRAQFLRVRSNIVYHLVFEATAVAFAGTAFGLDVYWFSFWRLVLDWIWALGIGFGLVLGGAGLLLDWL